MIGNVVISKVSDMKQSNSIKTESVQIGAYVVDVCFAGFLLLFLSDCVLRDLLGCQKLSIRLIHHQIALSIDQSVDQIIIDLKCNDWMNG